MTRSSRARSRPGRGPRRAARRRRRARRWSARPRQPPRPAYRRPAPRRRPARRTRCRTARRPGWRRRTSRRAPAEPPAGRTARRRWMPSGWARSDSDAGCSRPHRKGHRPRVRPAGTAGGVAAEQGSLACTSTSGAFSGWMRPANSSTSASCGRPSAARAEAAGGRRRGRHRAADLDARRVGVVEPISCPASSSVLAMSMSAASTTCSSPITRALGSGVSPPPAGSSSPWPSCASSDERHAPPVADQGADLAGQPVVGVHDVVPALVVTGLGAQHLRRTRTAGRGAPPWSGPRTVPRARGHGHAGEHLTSAAGRRT